MRYKRPLKYMGIVAQNGCSEQVTVSGTDCVKFIAASFLSSGFPQQIALQKLLFLALIFLRVAISLLVHFVEFFITFYGQPFIGKIIIFQLKIRTSHRCAFWIRRRAQHICTLIFSKSFNPHIRYIRHIDRTPGD